MPVADSCARIRVWDVLEQAQALRRPSPAAPFSAWRGRYASTIRLLTLALPERELAIGRGWRHEFAVSPAAAGLPGLRLWAITPRALACRQPAPGQMGLK